jgi:hypothetical protein
MSLESAKKFCKRMDRFRLASQTLKTLVNPAPGMLGNRFPGVALPFLPPVWHSDALDCLKRILARFPHSAILGAFVARFVAVLITTNV